MGSGWKGKKAKEERRQRDELRDSLQPRGRRFFGDGLYAERDIVGQKEFYIGHVVAMSHEWLHEKSDIAAELAHRDIEIEKLRGELAEAEKQALQFDTIIKQLEAKQTLHKLREIFGPVLEALGASSIDDDLVQCGKHVTSARKLAKTTAVACVYDEDAKLIAESVNAAREAIAILQITTKETK